MPDLFSFERQEECVLSASPPQGDGVPDGDGDGAHPRRSFLGRSLAAVTAVPALVMAGSSTGQAQSQSQNFLPTLYRGWNARNFQAIMRHENAHVAALVSSLGAAARPKPNFRNLPQPNVRTFATVSQTLENTGVGAYLGALPLLSPRSPFLSATGSIALIEARHAGYLNVLLNSQITMNVEGAEQNFEMPLTPERVVQLISPFILDLNGGPPLLPLNNDIDILNFALVTEFLEAEFYNINVPRFFGGGGPRGGGSQPQRAQIRRGNVPASTPAKARRRP